jgi:hypothetical protein
MSTRILALIPPQSRRSVWLALAAIDLAGDLD